MMEVAEINFPFSFHYYFIIEYLQAGKFIPILVPANISDVYVVLSIT